MRFTIAVLAIMLAIAAAPLRAEPVSYRLEAAESRVEFGYTLLGNPGKGTMPITRADLMLDFDNVARSSVRVTLNAAGTRAGIGPITDALKSADVLDTARHPDVRFVSSRVERQGSGARIIGDVTVRGVTRPMTLDAEIFRRAGSEAGDLSRLTVLLTGAIDRTEFGASGYAELVEDRVDLRIVARIARAP